jgi:proline iminopeptidase
MRARLNGTELYYDVEGPGLVPEGGEMRRRIPCFVLHGGPGLDHSYFKPWLSPLTDIFQLIYVDARGTGRSAKVPLETCRLPQLADDLEALRIHLGLEKVAVMGNSYGGFHALTYAVRYTEAPAMLILLGTAPSYRFWDRASRLLEEQGTDEQRLIGPRLFEGKVTPDEFNYWWKTMLPLYFKRYDEELGANIADRIRGNPRVAAEMFARDLPDYDVEDRLESIDAPTMVMVGRVDWVTPVAESEIIAAKVPNAELIIFEESGHFVFVEEHDLFLEKIRDFVRRHPID